MSIKKITLSLLVSSFILFTSCIENDKSLGSQFLSSDYILKIDTARFDLPLSIATIDSIQGYSSSSMIIGSLCDPQFGAMYSSAATMICPYSDSSYFGINPELKSVYIRMTIDSTVVYNKNQEGIAQNIYIYRLRRDMDSTMLFNTSLTSKDYDPVPISKGSPVFFGDDSLKIYLDENFGKELLSTTAAEFDSVSLFVKRIKGLYITTDTPEIMAEGGRLNYLSLGNSYIYLNYYLTDPQRGFNKHDTTETFMVGYGYALNSIRTSSDALASDSPTDKLYIESMSGVKPMISGVKLREAIDSWIAEKGYSRNSILISRASLSFPYEVDVEDYDIVTNQYPQSIFPCFRYAATDSIRSFRLLDEVYTNSAIGAISRSLKKYTCDITSYTQALIRMDVKDISNQYDLYLSPIYSYTNSSNNTYYSFDAESYRKAILNGPSAQRKPSLTITYAILNN
jgi:hypothetical protein